MTSQRKSTRPQVKTASRRAFEYRYGATGIEADLYSKLWEAFQTGWRLARGAKPTTREKEIL